MILQYHASVHPMYACPGRTLAPDRKEHFRYHKPSLACLRTMNIYQPKENKCPRYCEDCPDVQWVCPLPLQLYAETRNQQQAGASILGSFCSWVP